MKLAKLLAILIILLSVYAPSSQCMHKPQPVTLNGITSKDQLYNAITNAALHENMPQFSQFFDDAPSLHKQNPKIGATAKENANLTKANGKSVLMAVAHMGKKEFVAKLLKAEADPHYSKGEHSVLTMGLISGSSETAEIIIDAGVSTNSVLTKIVTLGDKTGVEAFLKLRKKIRDYKQQITQALKILNPAIIRPVRSTSTAQNPEYLGDQIKLIEIQKLLTNFEKQEKEAEEKILQMKREAIKKRIDQANKEKKDRETKQKKALIAAAEAAKNALKKSEDALAASLAAQREADKKKFEEGVKAVHLRETQANIDERRRRDQKQAEREVRREKEAEEERLKSERDVAVAQVKKEVKAQKKATPKAAREKPKNKHKKRNTKKSNYAVTNFEAQLIAQRKAKEERNEIERKLKAAKDAASDSTKK